jgi:hypothetical protein
MRLARVTAGALVAVAVLAGCSSKEPANDTLPSAAPTSAEPSETLPPLGPPDLPMPAEAREQTPAGAEAFLRYYLELVNKSQTTLDTSFLLQISDQCITCTRLIDGLDSYRAKDYSYSGGALTARDVNAGGIDGSTVDFSVSLSQASVQIVDNAGLPVADAASEAQDFPASGGSLEWDPSRSTWLMTEFVIA